MLASVADAMCLYTDVSMQNVGLTLLQRAGIRRGVGPCTALHLFPGLAEGSGAVQKQISLEVVAMPSNELYFGCGELVMGWVPCVLSQRLPCRCSGEEKGIFSQHHIPCNVCLGCCKAYGKPELEVGEGSLKAPWASLPSEFEAVPGLMASCSDTGTVLPCP